MKKIYSLVFLFLIFSKTSWSQVVVTVTNPTNTTPNMATSYTSLALAISALDAATSITGPVTLTCSSSGAETAPAGGYVINFTATTTATNNVVINGASSIITASSSQTIGAINDAIIKLIGVDYVTIQNFSLQENALNTTIGGTTNANVTNATTGNNMTEFGIALFYANTTNGSQNNIIQNNTLSLNRQYLNTFGIFSNAATTAVAPTSTAPATSASGANSYNIIQNNAIANVNYGVVIIGSNTEAAFDNGNNIIYNTVTNFGGGAAITTYRFLTGNNYAIADNHQINDIISFNNITSGTVSSIVTIGGILKNFSSISPTVASGTFNTTINNNTITITNNSTLATAGSINGILCQGSSTNLSGYTVNINNNIVQNCILGGTISTTTSITAISNANAGGVVNITNNSVLNNSITSTAATTGQLVGISNTGAATTLNITTNTIRGFSNSSSLAANYFGISSSGAVVTTVNINNNIIGDAIADAVTYTSTAPTGQIQAIVNSGGASTCTTNLNNNSFKGFVFSGSTGGSGNCYILNQSANVSSTNMNDNIFNNISLKTTGTCYLMRASNTTPNITISGNSVITAFSRTLTTTNGIYGIYYKNSATSGTHTIQNNNLATIIATTNNSGSTLIYGAIGIYWNGTSETTGSAFVISNNTISVNNNTGDHDATGIWAGNTSSIDINKNIISNISTNGYANGIYIDFTAAITNVYKNKIYGINATGSISSESTGIWLGSSSSTITSNVNAYNNLIGNITAPNINDNFAISGFTLFGIATTTHNLYFNTIYLSGTGISGFGSAGVYADVLPTVKMINNIIDNESVAVGSGLSTAYQRSSTTLATYASTSNNNDFYAGTPSATNLIYYDGTTPYQTLAAYQTLVAARDANSVTVLPNYISTTGSSTSYLHLSSNNCALDGTGLPITGYTTDFDAEIRNTSIPDIGADEIAGSTGLNTGALVLLPSLNNSICSSTTVGAGITHYTAAGCNLIASILPSGANPVAGIINVCATKNTFVQQVGSGEYYLPRHFDIEPSISIASTATATITLYVTQQEFDDFNAANSFYPDLPTGPSDVAGIANLRISQFHGTPLSSPSVPINYTGGGGAAATYIDPLDANIVWNATYNRWEVTFDVVGFSGFYIHTNLSQVLPAALNYLNGTRQNNTHLLNWKINCTTASATMILERSRNASTGFEAIHTITETAARCGTPFNFTDATPFTGINYYRVKIITLDGIISFTSTIALLNAAKGFAIVGIAPNPIVNDVVTLQVTAAKAGTMLVSITDLQGRLVAKQNVNIENGFANIPLNVAHLAKGVYFLNGYMNDINTSSIRFVK